MKIIAILLFISINSWAKTISHSFSDQVKKITVTNDGVDVAFELHAAFYKLKKDHHQYNKIKSQLEELQKSHKNIKITADMHNLEIKELAAE
jgi:YbbR domain-containing protein